MMTFAYQEQLLSKVGTSESIGNADAFLWTMPLAGRRNRAISTPD